MQVYNLYSRPAPPHTALLISDSPPTTCNPLIYKIISWTWNQVHCIYCVYLVDFCFSLIMWSYTSTENKHFTGWRIFESVEISDLHSVIYQFLTTWLLESLKMYINILEKLYKFDLFRGPETGYCPMCLQGVFDWVLITPNVRNEIDSISGLSQYPPCLLSVSFNFLVDILIPSRNLNVYRGRKCQSQPSNDSHKK